MERWHHRVREPRYHVTMCRYIRVRLGKRSGGGGGQEREGGREGRREGGTEGGRDGGTEGGRERGREGEIMTIKQQSRAR